MSLIDYVVLGGILAAVICAVVRLAKGRKNRDGCCGYCSQRMACAQKDFETTQRGRQKTA
jgi:hypothetical protein